MSDNHYEKAEKPALYFIGVTTGKSSIMRVFPAWARYLGLGDCAIKGLDFALHDDPRKYTAEIYLCLRGEGFLLMKTADGKCLAEPMTRGRMVYVPPFWAHRSVNTGASEPLISFCVYPAEAGHNYGDIATGGFPKRIVARDGKPVLQ